MMHDCPAVAMPVARALVLCHAIACSYTLISMAGCFQDRELAKALLEGNAGVVGERFRIVEDDVLRWLRRSPMVAELFPQPTTPQQKRAKARARRRALRSRATHGVPTCTDSD